VTFADTSLQEAIGVLKKRGCTPLPIHAAPAESTPAESTPAPAPQAERKKHLNNDDWYIDTEDDGYYQSAPATRSNTNRYPKRR